MEITKQLETINEQLTKRTKKKNKKVIEVGIFARYVDMNDSHPL